MTKIIKDIGFVLKRKKFRDTSIILSLFTKENGRIDFIAKGVRTQKNKLHSVLLPLNLIEFTAYFKENREMQFLTKAEVIESFSHLKSDFSKLQSSFSVIEIIFYTIKNPEKNPDIFDLLLNTFYKINESEINPLIYLLNFAVKFSLYIGFDIYSGKCNNCSESLELSKNFALSKTNGIICSNCYNLRNDSFLIEDSTKEILLKIINNKIDDLNHNNIIHDEKLRKFLNLIFDFYKCHVEGFREIKSLSF